MFILKMADHGLSFLPCCLTSLWVYVVSFVFIACTLSSTFRFFIKCSLLVVYYTMLSIFCICISLPTPCSRNNFHKVCNLVKWTQIFWGIQYNVKGIENYKEDSNYIIVSNHQSSFDMNVVANFMPRNTAFMAKRDALFVPFIGLVFWIGGVVFIRRGNHGSAMDTMKKTADQIKEEKFNLWIFPEGTRHMGGKLLPFKKGGFHLAQQTQLPILPIVVSNYENIVNFKEGRFTTGTIDITILPEVSTEGMQTSDVEDLTKKVYSTMCEVYERPTRGQ